MKRKDFDSKNLYKEWLQIEKNLSEKMVSGIKWIKVNDSDAVMIGAMAVVNYLPIPRKLTPDVDFLCTDIEQIKDKLTEQGIAFSYLYNNIGITIEQFNLDLLGSKEGNKEINDYALHNFNFVKVAGTVIKTATPEALTLMKFSSGRDKDDADAFNLLKSNFFNKEKFLKGIEELRKHLPDANEIIRYTKLIS